MFLSPLTYMFALAMTVRATPTCPYTNPYRRDVTMDTETGDHQLSTEAIIGVIGVAVALLGIASSLAWSKRGKSRSGPRHTSEGIHMSRFHHFEMAKLIRFARIDTLQLFDA